MKRILMVTPNTPGRNGGGSIASLTVLKALWSEGWNVHLVIHSGGAGLELGAEARALCEEVTLVEKLSTTSTPKGPGLSCLLQFGYWPRYQREVWDTVRALLGTGGFDLLFLDHLLTAECGRFAKQGGFDIPIVLREHNVESQLQLRALRYLRSARLYLEALARIRRWRAIESNLARYCDLVLPISSVDAAKLSALCPGFPVETLPAPVDTDHYHPSTDAIVGKEMVFIGGLGWRPNEDAVHWFIEEVFDSVRIHHPDAHLTVIGDGPPEWLRRNRHVSAVGFVPDERDLVARARVVIVPVRFGSGVRMKILNSLAMGKAVVSTRLGAEGIPVRDRHSILIADDAAGFAEAVSAVLADDAWVVRLGENGLRVCLDHYSPARLSVRLDGLLRRAARSGARSARPPVTSPRVR
jgi:polysaccharide biosynthesis protein PslH